MNACDLIRHGRIGGRVGPGSAVDTTAVGPGADGVGTGRIGPVPPARPPPGARETFFDNLATNTNVASVGQSTEARILSVRASDWPQERVAGALC